MSDASALADLRAQASKALFDRIHEDFHRSSGEFTVISITLCFFAGLLGAKHDSTKGSLTFGIAVALAQADMRMCELIITTLKK